VTKPKKTRVHVGAELNTVRIIVEKISFQGLSEDVDGDGWVTKLRGNSVPRQRAR